MHVDMGEWKDDKLTKKGAIHFDTYAMEELG